jgi:hypothetical protein
MDGSRFDQIARGMAAGSTRRSLLKALGGGTLAALGLIRVGGGAVAGGNKPAPPKPQSVCNKDAQCSAGLFCAATATDVTKRCRPGCRIGASFYASEAVDPTNTCQTCQPNVNTTGWTTKADGVSCDDGNVCAGGACLECDVDGVMVCAGSGFLTCDNGSWIHRDCAPGTSCRPLNGTVICDFPIEL